MVLKHNYDEIVDNGPKFKSIAKTSCDHGARCSSVVERPLMMRWVVGSILHGGSIDLFLVPPSVPRLV